jgi:hypothetical protein
MIYDRILVSSIRIIHWICSFSLIETMGKPSGIGAARKLVNIRRENKWALKSYRKKMNGALFKVHNSRPYGSLNGFARLRPSDQTFDYG